MKLEYYFGNASLPTEITPTLGRNSGTNIVDQLLYEEELEEMQKAKKQEEPIFVEGGATLEGSGSKEEPVGEDPTTVRERGAAGLMDSGRLAGEGELREGEALGNGEEGPGSKIAIPE